MCGKNGQKELDLLKGKVDQSTSNGENLRKTEDNHGSDILSSEEVCALYFICTNLH